MSCGMATAVGLDAPTSCAAIRAGISGFRETRIMVLGGEYLRGAEVPLSRRLHGLPRLAAMIAGPIRECLAAEPSLRPETVPLLLAVAEPDRPGRVRDLDNRIIPFIEASLRTEFHERSRVFPIGRVAGGVALSDARKLITIHGFDRVLVAGVDSYLDERTIDVMDDAFRLLTERNSDGFVPGEAGAAVLLGAHCSDENLRIRSLGFAVEKAVMDGDLPLRGDGLAEAYRQALYDGGVDLHEMGFRVSDASGEQYRFKEAAFAFARNTKVRKEFQDFWCPADCIGETGAAVIPCMTGIVWWACRKGYAPGPLSLLHAANDDGRRVAIVMEEARPRSLEVALSPR
nr:hypothetical protein [Caballeronia ptereochthonis]